MADTAKKPVRTPEQQAQTKAVRLVAYTVWLQSYRAANPKATDEERKAAWNAAKKDQLRAGRRALKALARKGFVLTPPKAA